MADARLVQKRSRTLKYFLVFLLSLMSVVQLLAQQAPFFVTLRNSQTHYGSKIVYERPILQDAQFVLDGVVYPADSVAFVQNHHGYFANLRDFYKKDYDQFAMRMKKAPISVYEEVDMNIYGGESLRLSDYGNKPEKAPMATGNHFHFYTKNEGPVKRATFKNLKVDLADKPAAEEHLVRFKRYRYLHYGLMAGGVAITLAEVLSQPRDNIQLTPFTVLGMAVMGSGFFTINARKEILWDAVDAYNAN